MRISFAWRPARKTSVPRSIATLVVYAMLIGMSVSMDSGRFEKSLGSHMGKRKACSADQERSGEWVSHLFQPILRHHLHARAATNVVLVTISEPPKVMTNTCDSRRFLSDLVHVLSGKDRRPSVIAIDQYFSESSCTDEKANASLRTALSSARAGVVVGESTHRPDVHAENECLVEDGSLFSKPIQSGITLLNGDSQKIPLGWWVFPDDQTAQANGEAAPMPGFALAAAQEYGKRSTSATGLRLPSKSDPHPYAPLLRFDDSVAAMTVLCEDAPSTALLWGPCNQPAVRVPDLDGKVVVIGKDVEGDLQPTPDGEELGMVLQASYVEDLLSGNYVRAIPGWAELALLASVLLLLYAIDDNWIVARGERAAKYLKLFAPLLVCATLAGMTWLLLYVGYFAPGLLVTAAVMLAFFLDRMLAWPREELVRGEGEKA